MSIKMDLCMVDDKNNITESIQLSYKKCIESFNQLKGNKIKIETPCMFKKNTGTIVAVIYVEGLSMGFGDGLLNPKCIMEFKFHNTLINHKDNNIIILCSHYVHSYNGTGDRNM